jgi:hypothetical protein
MKAILSPDLLSVLRIVPDDTITRPGVTRRYVDRTGDPVTFNPATEKLVVAYSIGPVEVLGVMVVAALTAEEIAAIQDAAADAATTTAIRNVLTTLEAGNATARQVQEILARLIRLLIKKLSL